MRIFILAVALVSCAPVPVQVKQRQSARAVLYSCLSEFGCRAERYCLEQSAPRCPLGEPKCVADEAWFDPMYPCRGR